MGCNTYKLPPSFSAPLLADAWFQISVEEGEGKVFDVALDLGITESTTYESFDIEDGIVRIRNSLDLGGIAQDCFCAREGNIRRCVVITVVVWNNLDMIVCDFRCG